MQQIYSAIRMINLEILMITRRAEFVISVKEENSGHYFSVTEVNLKAIHLNVILIEV